MKEIMQKVYNLDIDGMTVNFPNKLKQYIDEQLGFNVYDLFTSIKENL